MEDFIKFGLVKTILFFLLFLATVTINVGCATSEKGEINSVQKRRHWLNANLVTVKVITRTNGKISYKKKEVICDGCTYTYTLSKTEVFYDSTGRKTNRLKRDYGK